MSVFRSIGIHPGRIIRNLIALPSYFRDLRELKRQARNSSERFATGPLYPCLTEKGAAAGIVRGHYFHQDLYVARRIHEKNPRTHVDVGSRIDGFVAHVASFRNIMVVDIRALDIRTHPSIEFIKADVMDLPISLHRCCDSLSCLHANEHFGLGRYGDPIRFDGHRIGFYKMSQMLHEGGTFYYSVPIGPQRIEFNAHRVFSVSYLLHMFTEAFRVDRFSFVNDRGDLHVDVPLSERDVASNYGCHYGCGIFELTKV
jgi:hypothetical protein